MMYFQEEAQPDTGKTVSGLPYHICAQDLKGKSTGDENDLLRKPPIKEAPAFHLTYEGQRGLGRVRQTFGLPVGTQSSFIRAARHAAHLGRPLNRLLTLRWTSLFSSGEVSWLRAMPTHEQIAQFVERLRKWLVHRELPAFYIWVREAAGAEGEHWHMALHLSTRLDRAFADYIGHLTGEALAVGRRSLGREQTEVARGQIGS